MEIVVRYHNSLRSALARLREGSGANAEERQRNYGQLLLDVEEEFRGCDGLPPEALPEVTAAQTSYWFQFSEALLLQYTLRDTPPAPRGWWDVGRRLARRRGVSRRIVTVIGLVQVPVARGLEPPRDSSNPQE